MHWRFRPAVAGSPISAIVVLGLVFLNGCSGAPEATYPVEGSVRLDGKPVTHGQVQFLSEKKTEEGRSYTARATIAEDGSYRLTTFEENDGAVAGRHKILVMVPVLDANLTTGLPPTPPVPRKYTMPDQTPLSFEVKPVERNRHDIELKTGEQATKPPG